ncbi:uncharacterized protein YidB (DUF937 family) [Endobacter medicaginis]|uniref:Uncharacterized protein YidB (DUF937 family) n=2 Tax=Endobacter medicaginis TaxID=1181271 RepID=A0A839V5D8_9PROT|nr:YidB family protein [Endobacter medicaginis]MBB3174661.1 uncharacterized protein YidB (DUF937 family) [Endobacter medicaginis]MCX5474944.1 YidB family protein [Endobacter medicaginis]
MMTLRAGSRPVKQRALCRRAVGLLRIEAAILSEITIMSGILGGLLGSLTGGAGGSNEREGSLGGPLGGVGGAAIAGFVAHAIEQAGGIQGLIAKFEQAGMGDKVQSWIGSGANLPVSSAELQQVLPAGQIDAWAQAHGLPAGLATQVLAHVLPSAVDHATPQGADTNGQPVGAPAQGDAITSILGRLLG